MSAQKRASPTSKGKAPHQYSFTQVPPLGSKARAQLTRTLTPRTTHGGYESRDKRKTARPFTPKVPLHIVMKSSRAKGLWSLNHRRNQLKVISQIYVYAARFKVHVYRASNVGNHLHLLVKAEERKHLADFLRVLAGRVAVTVTGAKKHIKQIGIKKGNKIQKFWDSLCWSRLINWGRDFYHVRNYVLASENEAMSPKNREWVRKSGQEMANLFGWDGEQRKEKRKTAE